MINNLNQSQIGAKNQSEPNQNRPRWPALLALIAIGILYAILSAQRTLVPGWLLLPFFLVMIVVINIAHRRGQTELYRILIYATAGIGTLAMIASVILLVLSLPEHKTAAGPLLGDSLVLWVTNIIIFALWYWIIDGGGPLIRHHDYPQNADFLFPQTVSGDKNWLPGFIDYVFLAFNTSTAFSPTDTAVMSHRAKIFMMLQATLSLMMLAVLAARAINIF